MEGQQNLHLKKNTGIQRKSSSTQPGKEIKFDDFDKVEIRVAEVKEVSAEGSDTRFNSAYVGDEDRQILQELLSTIQTNKNWSAYKSSSCQPQTTERWKIYRVKDDPISWTWWPTDSSYCGMRRSQMEVWLDRKIEY